MAGEGVHGVSYYVIARHDGSRVLDHGHRVDLAAALKSGGTVKVIRPEPIGGSGMADELFSPVTGIVACRSPADVGSHLEEDAVLALAVDGVFRLFRVDDAEQGNGKTDGAAAAASPREVRRLFEFAVDDEVPGWWAYGPHGRMVAGLIQQVERLREQELVRFGEASQHARGNVGEGLRNGYIRALAAADDAVRSAERTGAASLARSYARAAAYRQAQHGAGIAAGRAAADAAYVLVVADLIGKTRVDQVVGPLLKVLGMLAPIGEDLAYPGV